VKAAELLHERTFGHMVCLRGNEITSIPLEDATSKTKEVPNEMYDLAAVFFQ